MDAKAPYIFPCSIDTVHNVSCIFAHCYANLANKNFFIPSHKSFLCLGALHLDYHETHIKFGTKCLCPWGHKCVTYVADTRLGWKNFPSLQFFIIKKIACGGTCNTTNIGVRRIPHLNMSPHLGICFIMLAQTLERV